MKRLITTVWLVVTLALFNSCSKEESSSNTPAPTRMELLTEHGWRLTNLYINNIDVTSAFFSPCELDNIFTYNTDYTYQIDEGPTKCISTDPQIIETGTWAFANNQNMIIYDPGSLGEAELNILQLDANIFRYEETEYDSTTMTTETYRAHFVKS